MVTSNSFSKSGAVLDPQKLKQCQLDGWFKYCKCSNLMVLWCKNVIVQLCLDMVDSIRLFDKYFKNLSYVCLSNHYLFAYYYQLKIENVENIAYQLRKI